MKKKDDNTGFSEKARIFSSDYLKCCIYISKFTPENSMFTKSLLSKLIAASQILEDFLDFHGAKNNTNWYFYRELTAVVRHLSLAGFSLTHILNRLVFYDIPGKEELEKKGRETQLFLMSSLMNLTPVVINEAERIGIRLPTGEYDASDFPYVSTNEMLDYDIDDENPDQERKNIVKIASEFLRITEHFSSLNFYQPYDIKEILNIVPENINEVEIRRFEMLVHNLQSLFDTYVIYGGYRFGNRELKQLRSFFSVVFHLLQMIRHMFHLYERHFYSHGYKEIYTKVRLKLSEFISSEILIGDAVNFGIFNVCRYLSDGKELAKSILSKNVEKDKITVGIPKEMGFHMRPSMLVTKIVNYYGAHVELCIGEDRFDASSVLDIQWAGGKIKKEEINEVVFEGDKRALKDIKILAEINYGEDRMGKGIALPEELKYLR